MKKNIISIVIVFAIFTLLYKYQSELRTDFYSLKVAQNNVALQPNDKYKLLYFGYTFCPDICPTSLTLLKNVAAGLDLKKIDFIFISVDTERDNAEKSQKYVEFFNKDFIGLSLPPSSLNELVRYFQVQYKKIPAESGNNYTIDHSSDYYLISPKGKVVKVFDHKTTQETMTLFIKNIL